MPYAETGRSMTRNEKWPGPGDVLGGNWGLFSEMGADRAKGRCATRIDKQ